LTPKVLLHVGYGKTGTSALQTFLAENADLLASHGWNYPWHPSFSNAKKGHISSGNGLLLYNKYLKPHESYIFSSEILFRRLIADNYLNSLVSKIDHKITVLLYCRNLFDHFTSSYNQYIKRHKSSLDLEGFIAVYGDIFDILLDYIIECKTYGIDLVIINYTEVKDVLIQNFINILGLDLSFLDKAKYHIKKVNRSLDGSELYLQSVFNKYYDGDSYSFISDPLINNHPDIEISKPQVSKICYNCLVEKVKGKIEKINDICGKKILKIENFNEINQNSNTDNSLSFSKEQLTTLVKSICQKLNKEC
jgi:hypothetical protein